MKKSSKKQKAKTKSKPAAKKRVVKKSPATKKPVKKAKAKPVKKSKPSKVTKPVKKVRPTPAGKKKSGGKVKVSKKKAVKKVVKVAPPVKVKEKKVVTGRKGIYNDKPTLFADPRPEYTPQPYVPNKDKPGFGEAEQYVEEAFNPALGVLQRGEVTYANMTKRLETKLTRMKITWDWEEVAFVVYIERAKTEYYLQMCLRFEDGLFILSDYEMTRDLYVTAPNELQEIFDFLETYNDINGKGQLLYRNRTEGGEHA